MNLFIIRHAESVNNRIAEQTDYETFVATRSHDPAITEKGEQQAERLALHLSISDQPEFARKGQPHSQGYGITRIVCSPMLRTLQTAAPIARALALPLEVWTDIHEQGGLFDGDPRSDTMRSYPGLTRRAMEQRFPGAILPAAISEAGWWRGGYEEMEECESRAAAVAERLGALAQAEPETRLAFVSHGTFLNHLLKHLLGAPPTTPLYFFHANTGITRVEYAADGFRVLRYSNRVPHLSGDLMTR